MTTYQHRGLVRAFRAIRRRLRPTSFRALQRRGIVDIGRHTYGTPEIRVWWSSDGRPLGGRVRIGSFVSIGPGVVLSTGGEHRTDWTTTAPLAGLLGSPRPDVPGNPWSRGDVVVGNDVWIGEGAMLRSGVTVGHGAVIGARAVVTADVREYAVVAGVPAKEVRRRFDDDVVDALLALRWWDLPDAELLDVAPLLQSDRVGELLARLRR